MLGWLCAARLIRALDAFLLLMYCITFGMMSPVRGGSYAQQ